MHALSCSSEGQVKNYLPKCQSQISGVQARHAASEKLPDLQKSAFDLGWNGIWAQTVRAHARVGGHR